MSRFPTFRRRFRNMLKVLYVEAIQAGASASHIGVALKSKYTGKSLIESGSGEGRNETDEVVNEAYDNGDVVWVGFCKICVFFFSRDVGLVPIVSLILR